MALARVRTWVAGEVLTASDLNAEFNSILNNPIDLWSPAAKAADMNGFELIMDADADSSLTADTDDRLDVRLSAVDLFRFDGTVASPVNGLNFIAGATGTRAVIDSGITGADANIGLTLLASGTGPVVIDNDTDPVQLRLNGAADGDNNDITDVNGNEIISLQGVASAVNELVIRNAATTAGPIIAATGETNIPINIQPAGTGALILNNGTDPVDLRLMGAAGGYNNRISDVNGNEIVELQGVASAVNQIGVINAITGVGPTIEVRGEANVPLNLVTAGTGVLRLNAVDLTNATEQILAARGGTAIDTSASTGVPSISSGTWSVAATLASTLGGTGVNTSARVTIVSTSYDLSTASGDKVIAHGVTGTPVAILIAGGIEDGNLVPASIGWSTGSTKGSLHQNSAGGWAGNTDRSIQLVTSAGNHQISSGTITFDATNITIPFVKTGTPTGTAALSIFVLF